MRRFAVLAVVVLGALASVTAAQASTTIGQTGAPLTNTAIVAGNEAAYNGYVVPAGGGVIVSLNTQASATCILGGVFRQGIYNLQVLRPLGGGQYRVLGETGNQTDPCDGQLHSYPVNIPVQAGDVLGAYNVSIWMGVLSNSGGDVSFAPIPEPAVGDIVSLPNHSPALVDESATLAQVPTSTSDCKDGGWQTAADDNGNLFKNQGDCVSYVATKGKNLGSG
jgi:hypothetical protein